MQLLDLLFPPRCVGCHQRGAWLCSRCIADFPRVPSRRCSRCADVADGVLCSSCQRQLPDFDSLACEFTFDGTVRLAIHRLKYDRARYLAPRLVAAIVAACSNLPRGELLVPVPLHPTRLRQRGYNQAALIARGLSTHLRIAVAEAALTRTRDTATQVTLPAAQRWANVRDSFAAEPGVVHGKHVVLVDDVATTTSTLRAASRALRRAGATRVDAIVIARAVAANPPRSGTFVAPSTP